MKVTPPVKDKILKALRQQRKTREQLAEVCKKKPSWVSKLLSDGPTALKNLDDEIAVSIEHFLQIEILATAVRTGDSIISETAASVAKRIDADEGFRKLAQMLDEMLPPSDSEAVRTTRYVPRNEMADIGKEIVRIAFAHEDKPGKVARLVLELLEQPSNS